MIKKIVRFFDKLEDRIRGRLAHFPIFYAFVGGVGIVVFWRGVWHTADLVMEIFFNNSASQNLTIDLGKFPWWDGPLSIIIGSILLLISGLFVSNFIGNEILISGLRGEKRLAEKTEAEVRSDAVATRQLREEVQKMSKRLERIEKKM